MAAGNLSKPDGPLQWWWSLIIIITSWAILTVTGSCTTTKYIPVEHTTVQNHTEYQQVHDSIYIHDSTVVEKRGDTVFNDRWHVIYKDRWRDRIVADTVRDTITTTIVVEKAEKKGSYKWLLSAIVLITLVIIFIKRRI